VEKDLIIHTTSAEVQIALLEDGKLVELHNQQNSNNFSVGDIFVGTIKKLVPGMNAAFVDIGHKKDAFLHYTDMGPKLRSILKYTEGVVNVSYTTSKLDNFEIESDINKNGKVEQVLRKGQRILVQLLKEPISTKGPRLSCELTIPGRYLVVTPFSDIVAVSKKIANSEERQRLQTLVESIKPKNFGVIVRTAAEGRKVADLHEELILIMQKWEKIYQQLKNAKTPIKLLSEIDKTSSILRDILSDSFTRIVTDDKDMYESVKTYLASIAPDKQKIASLHKGNKEIYEQYNVSKQIKSSFGKTANMSSGAYLVIEHTEAMHVIDVNSGHKVGNDQESGFLSVNLEAAEEVARQMRLRDLGGLIVIDFIDMKNPDHRKELQAAMEDHMKKDRAQHTVLPITKFGLMQITRQRVRPELNINTSESCPSCKGTGKINSSVLITEDINSDLNFIISTRQKTKLFLHVHPYIHAYLTKNWLNSLQMKWFVKFRKWINVIPDSDLHINEYHFYDNNEDEIRLE
jgi:ribonuclease G